MLQLQQMSICTGSIYRIMKSDCTASIKTVSATELPLRS